MVLTANKILTDRQHAAYLLAERLLRYRNSAGIVVGIGPGGALVGHTLARALNLPFELTVCRKITHPADPARTIGSISEDQVVMHDYNYDIPQDFLARHISRLQQEMKNDYKVLSAERPKPLFKDKIVILSSDLLATSDTIMAAIKSIALQKPSQVIVAVPIIDSRAATKIAKHVDDLVFLHMESRNLVGRDFYENFPRVEPEEVKKLWSTQ
jgi:predicted phosphoribosyltransferase